MLTAQYRGIYIELYSLLAGTGTSIGSGRNFNVGVCVCGGGGN